MATGGQVAQLTAVAGLLRRTRDVVVVTGAGISAASGIETYRSDGRQWDDQELVEKMRGSAYRDHLPALWRHWDGLRGQVTDAAPNAAHTALAAWERHLTSAGGQLTVVTQNIDDLHQRAGSTAVEPLHGQLLRVRCVDDCGAVGPLGDRDGEGVPRCQSCGGPQRPDVVLFDERLDPLVHHRAKSAARWCEAIVYVGTSGQVRPASHLHEYSPPEAFRILLNQDPWVGGGEVFDLVALGPAEEQLPALVDLLRTDGAG